MVYNSKIENGSSLVVDIETKRAECMYYAKD